MKLTQIPCEGIKKAKNILITQKYYIALSGQRVTFMNHSFETVKILEKFSYAYNGYVSPDEKYLLLIPTNSKHFYLVSLETLEIVERIQLKNKMITQEGCGCWSPDGRYMILIVRNPDTTAYEVRLYDLNNPTFYTIADLTATGFHMWNILTVPEHNAYYVLATSRRNEWTNSPDKSIALIKCTDGGHEIIEIEEQNQLPYFLEHNPRTDRFTVYTFDNVFTCGSDGKNVSVIDTGHENFFGLTPFALFPYTVKHIVASKNGKWVFMASTSGFDIFDKKTGEVILYKEYEYGATRIVEIEENLIAIAFYHGSMRLFRIEE